MIPKTAIFERNMFQTISFSIHVKHFQCVFWGYIGIWSKPMGSFQRWYAFIENARGACGGWLPVGQAVRRSEKSYSFMCGDGGTLAIGESFSTYVPKWFSHHFLSDFPWWHFVVIKFFFGASGVYSNTGVSRYIETLVLFFLQFSRNWWNYGSF